MDFRAQYLWEECVYQLEENSSWNPTTVESRVCTVKPAHVVTSIKQSPVLKGHFFLILS